MKNINIELTYIELTRLIISLEKNINVMESRGVDLEYPNLVVKEHKVLLDKLREIKRIETINMVE